MRIRQLRIVKFRGLAELTLHPGPRTVLLGANNAGKSTVLEALDLLLHPGFGRPRPAPGELDFHNRDPSGGFEVEAVLGDLAPTVQADVLDHLEGWRAARHEVVPEPDGDGIEPVIRVRVRADADLDLVHEFAKDESDGARFGPRLRQLVGWVFDGRARDPARQLAFFRGGALDRLFGDVDMDSALDGLRGGLATGATAVNDQSAVADVLTALAGDLRDLGLDDQVPRFEVGAVSRRELLQALRLAIADPTGLTVPLDRQGRGVQRLLLVSLLLRLSVAGEGAPIAAFEEPEEALEPLRQSQLADMLRSLPGKGGQLFVVTHSPEVVRAFDLNDIVLMSAPVGSAAPRALAGLPGPARQGYERRLDGPVVRALFARIPFLVEGPSDRAVLAVFWRELAEAKIIAPMTHLGVDIVNCEGADQQPGMATLLHGAGKRPITWAEQDKPEALTRLPDDGHTALLVHDARAGRQNLEGALAWSAHRSALAASLAAVADDRGYAWDAQRKDLLERLDTHDAEVRAAASAAGDMDALLGALPDETMRRVVCAALSAKKVTPFEVKGHRPARVFAEALVAAAGGVPPVFARALTAVAAWVDGGCQPPCEQITMSDEPAT